jgi:hypothetical protein
MGFYKPVPAFLGVEAHGRNVGLVPGSDAYARSRERVAKHPQAACAPGFSELLQLAVPFLDGVATPRYPR